MRKSIQLCLMMLLFSISLMAQKEQGYIKYTLTEFNASDPQMAQVEQMMKSTTQEVYFKPEQQKTVINMMNGMMVIQMFIDPKNNMTEQYMDAMGQKIKVTMSEDEVSQQKEMAEEVNKKLQMETDKSSTKEILGYPCYKMKLTIPTDATATGSPEMKLDMWITEKIQMKQMNFQNLQNININGTPMAYEIDMGMMKMTFEAQDFNDNVSDADFSKPEGEYQEMSLSDLQKMGGMGF